MLIQKPTESEMDLQVKVTSVEMTKKKLNYITNFIQLISPHRPIFTN